MDDILMKERWHAGDSPITANLNYDEPTTVVDGRCAAGLAGVQPGGLMRRGLYRYTEGDGEECACVDWRAGDGAPFLNRSIYEMLGFEPKFDTLPEFDASASRRNAPMPPCLFAAFSKDRPTVSG